MNNKKVLYIGTPIFNYHKKIVSEFKKQGYCVDYYDDRPSESSFIKGAMKIRKNLMNFLIQRYFDKIMSETRDKRYNLVFIINCKVFTPLMIQQLRDSQKTAQFVLYMWDSLTLYPNSKELIPIFDKSYSFDLDDCDKIDELTFRPLFFCEEYEKLGQEVKRNSLYDLISVCTAHPNRYQTMHELFPALESRGIRIFSYMFLNRLQYLYNKVFVSEFRGAKKSEFKFKPLSANENLAILKNSNTVFDMQHNMQSGLTMRTIETLGANRKLITTNKSIKKYDFYNENNIFVMDKHNLSEIEEFIKKDYNPINEDIYKKYRLCSWVNTIINE